MIQMRLDKERLLEVLKLSQLRIDECHYDEIISRVNDVLALCDKMADLPHETLEAFEWDVKKEPVRRKDEAVTWTGRDKFMDESPIKDGDFYRVPRIIALEAEGDA